MAKKKSGRRFKRVFQLWKPTALVNPVGEVIIDTNENGKECVMILDNNRPIGQRAIGMINHLDCEKFAVNILKALKSKRLKH